MVRDLGQGDVDMDTDMGKGNGMMGCGWRVWEWI